MLLSEIIKRSEEKSRIDWDAYCRWKVRQNGTLEEHEAVPQVWKCSCGAINTSVAGEKYGKCHNCGLVYLSFPK